MGDAGNLDTAWSDQRKSMSSNERIFDVIVIGSGIGGLAAAAALGKTGRRFAFCELRFSSLALSLQPCHFQRTFRKPGSLQRDL